MSSIYKLSTLSNFSSSDRIPVYSAEEGIDATGSVGKLLEYFQATFASPTLATNVYTPTTGFNIAVPTPVASQQWMPLQPAGTLAAGTITLPLNTTTPDGTEVLVTSTQIITALTVALNGATAAFGAPTTLAANGYFRLRFVTTTNSWYRIS